MKKTSFLFRLACFIYIFLCSPPLVFAYLDSEVLAAAYAVASGKFTAHQEALVFMHNKDLNLAALQGKIPAKTYQQVQKVFTKTNTRLVQAAASEAGLVATTQTAKPDASTSFNPGTDTDIIVKKKPGASNITEGQIKIAEKAYQNNVREYLKTNGVDPPAGKINTDTDFMPHPDHTSSAEFKKINEGINQRGGTAYESADAARVESKLRPDAGKSVPELTLTESGAYVTEMKNLANQKFEQTEILDTTARRLGRTNPSQAQKLKAEAQLLRSQGSKYIDRIDTVTGLITKQNGLPQGMPKPNDSLTEAGAMIDQGRGTASKAGADVIGDVGTLAVNRPVIDAPVALPPIISSSPAQ